MTTRSLPEKRNPLIAPAVAPEYEELLSRRRLGRTKLSVKPGQIGTSNATKAENLGPVEYAHLRAPLPEDLDGSEIFAAQANQAHPETYFLMRRSKDGFVSATGMFKIAFPWATHLEEKEERDYLKSAELSSEDEIAGNVWVSPEAALDIAKDYGLMQWITALLDPTDILQSPASSKKQISAPPKFELPAKIKDVKLSPPATVSKARGARSTRSVSPSKITPTKAKASPRKRQTKKEKEANIAHANAASASLQSALDDALSVAETTPAPEDIEPVTNGELAEDAVVRVEVDQAVEVNGDTEITHTNITVEMPAGSPELPLPEDTEAMLAKARDMVEKAIAAEGSSKVSRKRKAEEDLVDVDAEMPVQPAKKARVLEAKLKREKVRTRAVFGVAASLAVAAAIPFLQTLF